MSEIYISSGAFRGASLVQMAKACESIGAGLELSSGMRWHPGMDTEIEELVERKGEILIHNYFPPPEKPFVLNLASIDAETLNRSKAHVRAAIDLSARFGAPFYSVHSGFAMNMKAEDLGNPEAQALLARVPRARAYNIFLDSVRELSVFGKSRGVRLLVENNVVTREQLNGESPLLMTEPAEIARFLRDLDDSNVGLLLDVGHAKVSAQAMGFEPGIFFEELAEWIGAVHLSDNDGLRDNNRPFAADTWFGKYILRDVPVVIEAYGIGIEKAAEMVRLVKQWLGEK